MTKEEVCNECNNTNGEHKPGCSKAPTNESRILDRLKRLEVLREFTPEEIVEALQSYKFTHEVYEIRAALAKRGF